MHFVLLFVIVLDYVCLSNLEMIKIQLDVSISHLYVITFVLVSLLFVVLIKINLISRNSKIICSSHSDDYILNVRVLFKLRELTDHVSTEVDLLILRMI